MISVGVMVAALLAGFTSPSSGATSLPRNQERAEPTEVRTLSTGWTVPWGLDWLPDGSALIGERDSAKLFRLTQDGEKTFIGPVAEASKEGLTVDINGGLLGIAVSPHWERDHYIYVMHTAADGNRIARMTYDGSALGNYTVLLGGIQKDEMHNGGRLRFGPDGYLYATTGDARNGALAQDKRSLNGKILRLTTKGRPAPGNPFDSYVYSYGHRNPQGLAWDPQGRLWESEVGENTYDELNLIEPGKNYGWPECEGSCTKEGVANPKAVLSPSQGVPSGITYANGDLYMTTMRGKSLYRFPVDGADVGTPVAHYQGQYGRLRAVEKVPGKNALWVLTTNAENNGGQPAGSDQVLEVELSGGRLPLDNVFGAGSVF
ncbi:PQQ-dependent sugar dehydrogenase [Streptomyces sp. NPDC055400]